MEDKDEDFFCVASWDHNLEESSQLSKEFLVDADFLCTGSSGTTLTPDRLQLLSPGLFLVLFTDLLLLGRLFGSSGLSDGDRREFLKGLEVGIERGQLGRVYSYF